MTPKKIASVVSMYERLLSAAGVPKIRIDPGFMFEDQGKHLILAHAHYLCAGAKEFALDPQKYGKANRHLAAIQMCLTFVGVFTLRELMDHNRPRKAAKMTARK